MATRNTHQGKIPSQELRNLSKESICTETGLLGHVARGARSGNSLRVHLGHLANTQPTHPLRLCPRLWQTRLIHPTRPWDPSLYHVPVTANPPEAARGMKTWRLSAGGRVIPEGAAEGLSSPRLPCENHGVRMPRMRKPRLREGVRPGQGHAGRWWGEVGPERWSSPCSPRSCHL